MKSLICALSFMIMCTLCPSTIFALGTGEFDSSQKNTSTKSDDNEEITKKETPSCKEITKKENNSSTILQRLLQTADKTLGTGLIVVLTVLEIPIKLCIAGILGVKYILTGS